MTTDTSENFKIHFWQGNPQRISHASVFLDFLKPVLDEHWRGNPLRIQNYGDLD